jgi:hypothetical protein
LAYTNDYNYIISIGSGTNTTGRQSSIGFRGTGKVFQSAYTSPIIEFNYILPLKQWTHLSISHSNGASTLIVNGVTLQTLNITLNPTNTKVNIGAHTMNLSNTDSIISNVRIWDKALNNVEAKANMHRYLPADTPNLVEQWKLNEGVGSIIYGTKGNNGTITGSVTWTTPSLMNYMGKCATLTSNVANYIELSRILPTLTKQVTSTATFEFWLKPSKTHLASAGVGAPIIQFNSAGSGSTTSQQFGIWYGDTTGSIADEVISIALFKNYTSAYIIKGFRNSSDVYRNNWFHVAVVLTPTVWTCYIDGVQITLSGNSGNITEGGCFEDIAPTLVSGFIGQRNVGIAKFEGSIDDLRIWNVARTQTQIQENLNRTLGRELGLVLNMGFESNYYDASGYGSHGTPVGNPILEVTDNDKLLLNAPIT